MIFVIYRIKNTFVKAPLRSADYENPTLRRAATKLASLFSLPLTSFSQNFSLLAWSFVLFLSFPPLLPAHAVPHLLETVSTCSSPNFFLPQHKYIFMRQLMIHAAPQVNPLTYGSADVVKNGTVVSPLCMFEIFMTSFYVITTITTLSPLQEFQGESATLLAIAPIT